MVRSCRNFDDVVEELADGVDMGVRKRNMLKSHGLMLALNTR